MLHSYSPSESPRRPLKQPIGVENGGEGGAATDAAGGDDAESLIYDGEKRVHLQLDNEASRDLEQEDGEED